MDVSLDTADELTAIVVVIVFMLAADVVVGRLDPRIRLGAKAD